MSLFDEKAKFCRDRPPVLTAKVGTNADLFPDVLRIYAKPGDRIADVTYGRGVFWREVDTSQYECHFTDLAEDIEPPAIGGVDMRDLPYDDESMNMVVIDPPYTHNLSTLKASIADCYNLNEEASESTSAGVLRLHDAGMVEALRVLRPDGTMVVKCQDQIESGKQRWEHIYILLFVTTRLDLSAEDLFVLVQGGAPAVRWPHQLHARKNHSYFWVFRKKK